MRLFKRRHYVVILLLSLVIGLFENCAQQPAVENAGFSSALYGHTGLETSCTSCHAAARPQVPVGSHAFPHTNPLWGGTGDCIACHQTGTWLTGQFSHDPKPNTCQECHRHQRPSVVVGTPLFNHTTSGQGDCVGCHTKNTLQFASLADWAGGEYMPTDLISVKSLTISAGRPTFSGTTILQVTTGNVSLPLQMLHSSDQLPLGAIDSCVSCHTNAASGNMLGGQFHSRLGALTVAMSQPTLCLDCHRNGQPTGFVGPVDASRSPASAKMRHEATIWNKNPDGTYSAGTTPIVTEDCSTCHKSPGGSWAGTTFHPNLASSPASCIACHANSRPPGSFGVPLFNHYTRGGTQECTTCHAVTNFASVSGWANGQFPHTAVTACAECHNGQRPSNTTGWTQTGWTATRSTMDYAKHGGTEDCKTCHAATVLHNTMSDWATGDFSHSPAPTDCTTCHAYPVGIVGANTNHLVDFGPGQNCIGCHVNVTTYTSKTEWQGAIKGAMPAGLVNGDMSLFTWTYWTVNPVTLILTAGKVTSTATTTGVKLPMQMMHSSNQVPPGQISNCTSCHTAGTKASSGTRFHTRIATQPTANCASCHAPGAIATGVVGPIPGSPDATVNMDHNAKYASGQIIVQAQDCSTCHKSPGNKWSDAALHANIGTNSLATCTACHGAKMPQGPIVSTETYTSTTGQIAPQHFAHTSSKVTQDCAACHLQRGPAVALTKPWESNVNKLHVMVGAASLTACNECHTLDKPAATVWYNANSTSKYLHSTTYRGDADCFTCHTKKATANFTDITKIGVTWSGALYNHKDSNGARLTSSTCATCHTSFVWGTPVNINGAAHNCTECHATSKSPRSFYEHHKKGFGNKSTQRSACMSCHGTAPF